MLFPDLMTAYRAIVHIPADNLDILSSTTPLYTQMVDNLASIDDEAADSEALADVERTFMFGSIMETPVPGRWCQHAPDRMVRLEWVLELLRNGEILTCTSSRKETIQGSVLHSLNWCSPTETCRRS